jgi:hypothetical protein
MGRALLRKREAEFFFRWKMKQKKEECLKESRKKTYSKDKQLQPTKEKNLSN